MSKLGWRPHVCVWMYVCRQVQVDVGVLVHGGAGACALFLRTRLAISDILRLKSPEPVQ